MYLETGSKHLGIRPRLAVYFLVVFGVVFGLFCTGLAAYVVREYKAEFDANLHNYAVTVSEKLSAAQLAGKNELSWVPIPESALVLPFAVGETLLQVTDQNERVLLRSHTLQSLQIKLPSENHRQHRDIRFETTAELKAHTYRLVVYPFERFGKKYVLQAAVPLILLERQKRGLFVFLAIAVPLLLIIASLLGLSFSERALRPVASLIRRTNEIEAKNLSERLPVPEPKDEIQQLVITLNGLLNRLERAFRSQESFISDASHQLRTPLAVLRGELQVFRRGERTAEELEEWLVSAEQEILSLSRMVEDLLIMAKADAAQILGEGKRFELDEKVLECVSRLTPLAEKRDVSLLVDFDDTSGGKFTFSGDSELLRALFENLIENAIKYSPVGGRVKVALRRQPSDFRITVEDSGPGIDPAALPHIFDRFFRAEATRNLSPGSGLGLSIAQRVAEIHRGRITAANAPTAGAIFQVFLPWRHV